MRYFLTIDFGTSALKSALYDSCGGVVKTYNQEYDLEYGESGIIEIDLKTLEDAFYKVVHNNIDGVADPDDIMAIGFSSSAETMLFLDNNDEQVIKGITWMDTRAAEEVEELTKLFGQEEIYLRTGQAKMDVYYPAPKLLWLSKHQKDKFNKINKVLFMKDYFIYKLTGRFVSDDSVLNTTTYWDIKNRCYWEEMLMAIGIQENRLPEILYPGDNVAHISKQGARLYGLSTNTMINVGAQDQMSGALGAGNIEEGILSVSFGSAMMALASVDDLIFNKKDPLSCSPSALKGRYMVNGYSTGAIAMRWFRDAFCKGDVQNSSVNLYDLIDIESAKVEVGSDGLLMLPFIQGSGIPLENDEAKGVFFGITPNHTKYHFSRALMEGVAFSLKEIIDTLEIKLNYRFDNIICIGGGAKSKLWMQIVSDVTGLKVNVLKNSDTVACDGAMILLGLANGLWDSPKEVLDKMEFLQEYIPNFDNSNKYSKIYDGFIKIHESINSLY